MADEFDLKPTSRGEEFLDVILRSLGGETPDIPQPAWRYEEYLAAIANAIQNGGGGSSGGGVLVVHEDWDTADGQLDKTWQEIHDAPFCVLDSGSSRSILCQVTYSVDDVVEYDVYFYDFEFLKKQKYTTNSRSGYPVYTE